MDIDGKTLYWLDVDDLAVVFPKISDLLKVKSMIKRIKEQQRVKI